MADDSTLLLRAPAEDRRHRALAPAATSSSPASSCIPGPATVTRRRRVLSVEHLLDRWRLRHDEIRVVTGHFPLCTTELLDVPFTTLTLLRDPVERTLSYLRHHREPTPADRERPLEEIYDDPVRFELLHNHMVKMLSLHADEMTDGALTPVRVHPRPARAGEGATRRRSTWSGSRRTSTRSAPS